MRRAILAAFTLITIVAFGGGLAHGQTYPNKPITMVVPYAAGGTAEVLGRILAQQLGDVLGQSIVVEIKAGAGSMIGAEYVAKIAKPDGYTILFTGNPIAINVALMNLSFDPVKDLAPVAGIAAFPSILVTSATSPYMTLADVIKASKTTHLTFGSSGPGTHSHMSGELVKAMSHFDMTHVRAFQRFSSYAASSFERRNRLCYHSDDTVCHLRERGAIVRNRNIGWSARDGLADNTGRERGRFF